MEKRARMSSPNSAAAKKRCRGILVLQYNKYWLKYTPTGKLGYDFFMLDKISWSSNHRIINTLCTDWSHGAIKICEPQSELLKYVFPKKEMTYL
jgi:hypothetical protein